MSVGAFLARRRVGARQMASVAILALAAVPASAQDDRVNHVDGDAGLLTLRAALPLLRGADAELQQVFVESAVEALSDHYLAAARGSAEAASWAHGIQVYVEELWRAVDAVHAGHAVTVLEDADASIRVVVASNPARQFALVPPQPDQRTRLEAEVMSRLCARVDCRQLEPPRVVQRGSREQAPLRIQAPPREVSRGAVTGLHEGGDGLDCSPGDSRHRRLRESACERLLAEIRELAVSLHDAARQGMELDWDVLMQPRWRDPGRSLEITASGTTLAVHLPLLARFPQVLIDVMPWLRARLGGRYLALTFEPPQRLIYAGGRTN